MNVLFITYDFPYPITSGGKNRAYNLIKVTAKKANIYLYSFVREDYNPDSNKEILDLGVNDIKVFKRRKLTSLSNIPKTLFSNSSIFKTLYFDTAIEDEIMGMVKQNNIDIVHFESSYTGYYIGKKLKKAGVRQILGTENIEFSLYYDYVKRARIFKKPFVLFEANKLRKEELEMVRNADKVTVVTQEEKDVLERLTGIKSSILANGIDPVLFPISIKNKPTNNLLFVGNFSYFPNIDAINFFYNEVFGKLDKNFTLTIIGKNANSKLPFEDKRIIKKDFVEDIIEEYRNADALVFPIRIGGGTNFKVLEAMALGTPVIAHPDRLIGIGAKAETHFLKAVTPEEFGIQIKRLYKEPDSVQKIARNARKLIEDNFTWDAIGEDLLRVWRSSL